MSDVISWVFTGGIAVVLYGVAAFIVGFIQAIYRDLKKADATFDHVVATAIENFPDAYIWVRRGPLDWVTDWISVTIITSRGVEEVIEVKDWLSFIWNPVTHRFDRVRAVRT